MKLHCLLIKICRTIAIFTLIAVIGFLALMNMKNGRGIYFLPNAARDLSVSMLLKSSGHRIIPPFRLATMYAKLTFKQLVYNNRVVEQEKIKDFVFSCDSYRNLRNLFAKFFIEQSFFFIADKNDPRIMVYGDAFGMVVLYFKMLYPNAVITVLNPCDSVSVFANKNIKDNHCDDVSIIPVMMDDSEQLSRLFLTIDGRIDLLTIDIEGAERFIIQSFITAHKLNSVNEIYVNYHLTSRGVFGAFLTLLESNGFVCRIHNTSLDGADCSLQKGQKLIVHALRRIQK
jgi:hypothetical protein